MLREEIISALRQARIELQGRDIQHARLFGSVACNEDRPDSDIDLAVSLDPNARISLLDFVGLERDLAKLLGRKVDLVKLPVKRSY